MGKGKQPSAAFKRKKTMSEPAAKPCPTCYAPMKQVGKESYECAKHGAPTRR